MAGYSQRQLVDITDGRNSYNSTQTDLLLANFISGMQINGRISAVRRSFCLFVTFDFLFTTLFWIICMLIGNKNLIDAILEFFHYNIKETTFDIVVCAFVRFVLLLLFYAIICIHHWWLVAITTAVSCGFLITKTLLYHWQQDSGYPFEVMLVLVSFILAWAEAWFVDFRVLSQEAKAQSILQGVNNEQLVRDPVLPHLERVRDYLSHYTESVGNFYSPLESPEESDDEHHNLAKTPSPQDLVNLSIGRESFQNAWQLLHSSDWKVKRESEKMTIYVKNGSKYKIYKLTGIVDISPFELYKNMAFNVESIPQWNRSITECRVIQRLDACTDIVYQVSSEGPGRMIPARDFVCVRHWGQIEGAWLVAVKSVVHAQVSVNEKYVRGENGCGCFAFQSVEGSPERCHFQWVLDTDLKGWIPLYVKEQAICHAFADMMSSLYLHASSLRNSIETQPNKELV